jgi:hypothetical protein
MRDVHEKWKIISYIRNIRKENTISKENPISCIRNIKSYFLKENIRNGKSSLILEI